MQYYYYCTNFRMCRAGGRATALCNASTRSMTPVSTDVSLAEVRSKEVDLHQRALVFQDVLKRKPRTTPGRAEKGC